MSGLGPGPNSSKPRPELMYGQNGADWGMTCKRGTTLENLGQISRVFHQRNKPKAMQDTFQRILQLKIEYNIRLTAPSTFLILSIIYSTVRLYFLRFGFWMFWFATCNTALYCSGRHRRERFYKTPSHLQKHSCRSINQPVFDKPWGHISVAVKMLLKKTCTRRFPSAFAWDWACAFRSATVSYVCPLVINVCKVISHWQKYHNLCICTSSGRIHQCDQLNR